VENKKAKKNKKQKLNENIVVPDEEPKKQSKKKKAAKDGDGIEGGVPAEASTEGLTEGKKKKKETKSKGAAEEKAADPKVDSGVGASLQLLARAKFNHPLLVHLMKLESDRAWSFSTGICVAVPESVLYLTQHSIPFPC
jgi:hypothetical protein